MVYARKVKDRTLTLQVSGLLWNRSLVIRDIETGSLWSHILGECMKGKLKGEVLEILPASMTTWADWKKHHPGTTVLHMSRTERAYDRSFYQDRSRFVLGLHRAGRAKAYALDVLEKQNIVQDRLGKDRILVVFDPESTRALLFDRRVAGKTLSFKKKLEDGALVDLDTGSRWSASSGKAIAGKMQGRQLRMLPAIISFRRAWETFHPKSLYHEVKE